MASLPKGFSKTVSTLGAVLRGIGRVDGNQRPASFFRFAGQALPETATTPRHEWDLERQGLCTMPLIVKSSITSVP